MPARHDIDNKNNLITTTWTGKVSDSEMVDALREYQREIKSNPDYFDYNEIVDFSEVTHIHITFKGMEEIREIAIRSDRTEINTKLAFITVSPLAYGLARIYEVYRNVQSTANKTVKVFKKASDAYKWLGINI